MPICVASPQILTNLQPSAAPYYTIPVVFAALFLKETTGATRSSPTKPRRWVEFLEHLSKKATLRNGY